MKLITTDRFAKSYAKLPSRIQLQVDKQLDLLLNNPHHPSLNFKKMRGILGKISFFEIRVSQGYRIVFQIQDDYYILYNIGSHDILERV